MVDIIDNNKLDIINENKIIENKIISEKQRKLIRKFQKIRKPVLSLIKTTQYTAQQHKSSLNQIKHPYSPKKFKNMN